MLSPQEQGLQQFLFLRGISGLGGEISSGVLKEPRGGDFWDVLCQEFVWSGCSVQKELSRSGLRALLLPSHFDFNVV